VKQEFTMSEPLMQLSAAASRVLGALLEKETTTPEYYPLSLVALISACNQRSSRNPVMELTEGEVREALHELEEVRLAGLARGSEGRVAKYVHHVGEIFNLRRGEFAILCVLLLRGPQTPGELRSRTERMHSFAAVDEVENTLQQLEQREPPLARALPRERGAREVRYVHLLSPAPESEKAAGVAHTVNTRDADRLTVIEEELADLRARISALDEKLNALLG
jgi:uncharacterized protein YceH (UPF0502 family)